MKWLLVNAINKDSDETVTVAVNPNNITYIRKGGNGNAYLYFGEFYYPVTESFEEVMAMLGGDCEWKMP